MKNISSLLGMACLFSLLFSSCAKNISSDNYASYTVGEVSRTLCGTIQNMREVCVSSSDELGKNSSGMLAGGVGGGVLGSAIGGGLLSTAIGTGVGAIGGALVEKNSKQQSAVEYVILMDDGSLMTVVQGKDVIFNPGQPVYVIISQLGRSRIIARQM